MGNNLSLGSDKKGAGMDELERTALNEIMRTVIYIAEKVDEIDSKISLDDSQAHEHQGIEVASQCSE